jgi:glycosyltransferase involved in cell wall biosynthesis
VNRASKPVAPAGIGLNLSVKDSSQQTGELLTVGRRLNILVSAYACEPNKGSEPGIGWNQVRQTARFHEVWVITRSNNGPAIANSLAADPMANVHWIYCDLPRWLRFWKKGMRGARLYYYLWQTNALRLARKHHRHTKFDIVHHVTFGNYWQPTFLHFLPARFVWGPVGGGESAPANFLSSFGLRGSMYEILRSCARKLAELHPSVRRAARHASVAVATTEQTACRLRRLGCTNVSVLCGIGIPDQDLNELKAFPFRDAKPFRVLSVGRLLHWKGFQFALRAFGRFHAKFPEAEYWLVGEGPERRKLEQIARRMGLERAVTLLGQLPRREALAKYLDCDALLFPSFHESGGWVCLEAMAAGRPVICLDLGGPGLQVTSDTGIKVAAVTPEQVVADLSTALERLAADPAYCQRLGAGGRSRVDRNFSWERKGEQIAALYTHLASG